jgi:hypothetical protein
VTSSFAQRDCAPGLFAALPHSKALSPLPAYPILLASNTPRNTHPPPACPSPLDRGCALCHHKVRQTPCGQNSIGVRCYFAAWGLPAYRGAGTSPGYAPTSEGSLPRPSIGCYAPRRGKKYTLTGLFTHLPSMGILRSSRQTADGGTMHPWEAGRLGWILGRELEDAAA